MRDLAESIRRAFSATPHPGVTFAAIAATERDEGIYDYFVNSGQWGHRTADLRYHSCALSFFTHAAFRYWLPAFMMAEIEDPVEADIIGESIAFHLSDAWNSRERISVFSDDELESVVTRLY